MRRVSVPLLLGFMLIPAWTSAAPPTAGKAPAVQEHQQQAESPSPAVERMLHRLGKGLARALESEEMRSRLHKMLGETPYVEGRIALKRLLQESTELRSVLLGEETAAWKNTAAILPELELYFPDREHRSEWRGEAEVAVAVPIRDGERYRIYSPGGAVQEIKGGKAPETPTLLLAVSEIDYDDLESALVGGKRTGPYLERLINQGKCGTGAAPNGSSQEPAAKTEESVRSVTAQAADASYDTFVTLLRIKNDYEGWPRGSNEIEMFGNVDGGYSACARVTDIDEDRDYYYTLGTRRVSTAGPNGTSVVNVTLYEDDDDGCVIRSGDDYIGAATQSAANLGSRHYYTNFDLTLQTKQDAVCGDFVCEAGESIYCCECSSCGDLFCNPSCGEDNFSCGYDCTCGNFYCDFNEDYWSCPQDCTCGNFTCDFGEDSFSCPQDC